MSCKMYSSSIKLQISLQKHRMTISNCWYKYIRPYIQTRPRVQYSIQRQLERRVEEKNLDTMEINEIQRKKGKSSWYYQICTRKGFKNKSKMHNMVDYYDKPSNEDKYPYKTSFQKPSPPGPSKNKSQSFRAWLMKMLEKDSDDLDFSPEDVKINSTTIEEIPNPIPPREKGKRTSKLDFFLRL